MDLIFKIIIVSTFFNINLFAQKHNDDFFYEKVEPKLKRGVSEVKVIVWSDKKTYIIGDKIRIVVEWNKGSLIDEVDFKKITNLSLISTSNNQSYVDGEVLYNRVYTFRAKKRGKIKLPPFKIKYDFIKHESCKLKIRIKDNRKY